MKIFILSILLLSNLFSGGSLPLKNIKPILEKNTKLWSYIQNNFELSNIATGRRLGKQWIYLSGKRISPYFLKVLDSNVSFISVNCDISFLDKNGTKLSPDNSNNIVKIIEYPSSITLYFK